MNPEEKVRWCVYGVIGIFFRIVFIDITKKNFTINPGYCFWAFMYSSASFGLAYTIANYEMDVAANAVSLLMANLQYLIKYLCLRDMRGLIDAADFLIEIYRKNLSASDKFPLFENYAKIGQWITVTYITYMVFVSTTYLSFPAVWYFVTGARVTPLPVYFPYWDESDVLGYSSLTLYHSMLLLFTASLVAALETTVLIVFINVLMLTEIFKNHTRETNISLLDVKRTEIQQKRRLIYLMQENEQFTKCVKLQFSSIYLLMSRNVIHSVDFRLLRQLNKSTFTIFFCHIASATCMVIAAIYQAITVKYA